MNWEIEKGLRADIVCYAAKDLSGKRTAIQIFPGGNRKGDVRPADLASMVIRARHGTRVVLVTTPGNNWESEPWRCVRMIEGQTLPSQKKFGLPGIRLPDLDLLDSVDAKRTNRDLQSSYPRADHLADGEGWTFGRIGPLKGRVTLIRVERDVAPDAQPELSEGQALARALIEANPTLAEPVAAALQRTLEARGEPDAADRAAALLRWASDLAGRDS